MLDQKHTEDLYEKAERFFFTAKGHYTDENFTAARTQYWRAQDAYKEAQKKGTNCENRLAKIKNKLQKIEEMLKSQRSDKQNYNPTEQLMPCYSLWKKPFKEKRFVLAIIVSFFLMYKVLSENKHSDFKNIFCESESTNIKNLLLLLFLLSLYQIISTITTSYSFYKKNKLSFFEPKTEIINNITTINNSQNDDKDIKNFADYMYTMLRFYYAKYQLILEGNVQRKTPLTDAVGKEAVRATANQPSLFGQELTFLFNVVPMFAKEWFEYKDTTVAQNIVIFNDPNDADEIFMMLSKKTADRYKDFIKALSLINTLSFTECLAQRLFDYMGKNKYKEDVDMLEYLNNGLLKGVSSNLDEKRIKCNGNQLTFRKLIEEKGIPYKQISTLVCTKKDEEVKILETEKRELTKEPTSSQNQQDDQQRLASRFGDASKQECRIM